ncbi:pyruvate ferredoxin oxidoreductase [Roseburia sp. BX1005]|uniref:Pyruvate ferredoxin oxidoreductase n=1 Tax=Roseburia zhanii TaxID=2763064 RepID=A0A923LMT4_9FIRM|nr:pyruvate ferredoxin oxidoreductase [Roseburia zhanii]MBC5713130.1 pyruvate ferredoxin oxidoreductase [Roseburia zhanii]
MAVKERMSGNEAVAYAMKQINPDVMPAFPITPSTELPQFVSSYIANGEMDTEFIPVESEHSAMSAAIGAEAAGARTMTATSSAGMALMWEMLYVAASNRLPIALALVNRALSGPLNINCEHSDSMGARDAGWIQIYAEDNQEAYDNFVQAYRIAEHKDVMLPIMICQDGFIISHGVQNIELLEDEKVKAFVGEYEPEHYLLNEKETMAVGPYAVTNYGMEAKRAQAQAMMNARQVILDVAAEYEKISGRKYGFFEEYRLEDADYAIVAIGSACGTTKDAIDELRAKGIKAGLLKVRVFRPFPGAEMAEALKNCKAIAIMDRCESYSANGGPLAAELSAALFKAKSTAEVLKIVYGLNGRDFTVEDAKKLYEDLADIAAHGNHETEEYRYIGLRD